MNELIFADQELEVGFIGKRKAGCLAGRHRKNGRKPKGFAGQ